MQSGAISQKPRLQRFCIPADKTFGKERIDDGWHFLANITTDGPKTLPI